MRAMPTLEWACRRKTTTVRGHELSHNQSLLTSMATPEPAGAYARRVAMAPGADRVFARTGSAPPRRKPGPRRGVARERQFAARKFGAVRARRRSAAGGPVRRARHSHRRRPDRTPPLPLRTHPGVGRDRRAGAGGDGHHRRRAALGAHRRAGRQHHCDGGGRHRHVSRGVVQLALPLGKASPRADRPPHRQGRCPSRHGQDDQPQVVTRRRR